MFEISKVFLIKQQKNAILGINENSIKNFKRTLILAFRVFGNICSGKKENFRPLTFFSIKVSTLAHLHSPIKSVNGASVDTKVSYVKFAPKRNPVIKLSRLDSQLTTPHAST